MTDPDPIEQRARARVGEVLDDKWTLEKLLGVGGMGAVYEARHRNGARAAVKVLHPELSRHEDVRLRFQREGYAANSVGHPGAVKVLDDDVIGGGPEEGTAFIVMELLEGESLEDRLERGERIGEEEFLVVAEQVLDVLAAAHRNGVVHRDLKPENLFFARDPEGGPPRVKVLDFGLARLLQGQAITTYGLALGTPSFMSPEQAAGRINDIDGRSDLFSLAASGFRIVAGRRIHEGANAVELVTKMANVPPPKLRDVAPQASAPFARVIDRALEFRREDRYPTAEVMRDDVRRALDEIRAASRATTPAPPSASRPRSVPPAPPVVELSSSELKSVAVDAPLPIVPAARPPPARERRSVLPWIALAVWTLVGAKILFDMHGATHAQASPAPPPAASPSAAVAFDVQRVEAAPAPPPGPTAARPSATAAAALATSPPRPAAGPTASPHPTPRPPPRDVHHAPRKHGR